MMDSKDREREIGSASTPPEASCRKMRALVISRYLLPVFVAVVLLILGFFHNVFTSQGGQELGVSLLALWANSIKAARAYLLEGDAVAGGKAFYRVILFSACAVAVLFLVSLLCALFALYVLRRVVRAHGKNDREGEKEAKILFRAFLPNRAWLFVSNLLVLPLALFPEIFSFVCGRFLAASKGQALYVRFNVTAVVVLLFLLALLVVAVFERRLSRSLGLDLFFVDEGDSDGDENEGDEAE